MYPSIKYKLVQHAVLYFAQVLSLEDKEKVETCLDMIKFGMGNTLLTFVDKYYEYGGEDDVEEWGLMIGRYELAWLVDLVASYVLESASKQFKGMQFKGIYRDDGFVIFEGNLKAGNVADWLRKFQQRVNELAGSDFLKFTAEVWGMDKDDGNTYGAVMVRGSDWFPYLDMEMFWSTNGELQFWVHLKENQQLKYLNRGSKHTEACFQVIPSGVLR